MAVSGVSGGQMAAAMAAATGNNTDNARTASRTTSNELLGQDAFLKLLVTQLQNQNPLEPMSDTDFIAQMAQFSALEQMTQVKEEIQGLRQDLVMGLQMINETLKGLGEKDIDTGELNEAVEALNLVGKNVRAKIDETVIEGIVESVKNLAASPTLLVAGRELGLRNILKVLS